ncbi:hypothetical protein JIG36_00355 [Actinoplanes sp. LDG1-06]|uniref:CYTH domain-containing protein n=1 Tax=Paractinoplanes ovalisporus TaxID=2810368 RepID=A0ABS2A2C7_9ACTN|nr:hypothetical protein [Actinoplanes ovalisporus]MBM2614006.1 hypothetical protein [Actinoplanes ovalisporus]
MTRLDAVQIKVTLTGAGAAGAAGLLGLSGPGEPWSVLFCERAGAGLSLYDRGVILRLRQRPAAGGSTVKLRPCRRSRLTGRWLRDQRVRIEEDWSDDRVLAASLDARLRPETIAGVHRGALPLGAAFTADQRAFLADCGELPGPLDELVVLGPVRVRSHGRRVWAGYDVEAAWWFPPGTPPVLELTLRVEVAGAEVVWRGFDARLARAGVTQRRQERTTRLILDGSAGDQDRAAGAL